ncbi:B-box type zinc finger protein ncl-1-like [Argopecten irradians]|uniref:B-box type zinc finger protein ncl-1-like n=1 Tax=Argopecten irradians TaxID=31199 RepID=UPI00371A2B97
MKELLQELYKCGICGGKSNCSKKLRCQHSFCKDCLVNHILNYFGSAYFPCPTCSYKHVPREPETEVSEQSLLELREDVLTKDLQRFYKEGDKDESDDEIPGKDIVSNLRCMVHSGFSAEFYCNNCNTVVCEECTCDAHAHCSGLRKIEEGMTRETYLKCLQVFGHIENAHSQAKVIEEKLKSKLDNLKSNEQQVEKVKSYFVDLKEKISRFLEDQEQSILAKVKNLQEKEVDRVQTDLSVCESVAKSLIQFENLIMQIQMHANVKPAQNMILVNHLEASVLVYNQMLPEVEANAHTSFDLRVVINTEHENQIFGSDILNIEVINSTGRDTLSAADTTEDNMTSQRIIDESSTSDASVSTGDIASPAVANEFPVPVTGSEETSGQAFTHDNHLSPTHASGRRSPSASTELDMIPPPKEDAPPSYSSVVHDCAAYGLPSNIPSDSKHPLSLPQSMGASNVTPSAPGLTGLSDDDDEFQLPSTHKELTRRHSPDFKYPASASSSSPFAHLVANIPKELRQTPVYVISGFELRNSVSIRLPTEGCELQLAGIVRIKDVFVVLNQTNRCLKMLKRLQGKVKVRKVFSFEKDVNPTSVVAISDIECVVTCPNAEQLVFLTFDRLPTSPDAKLLKIIKAGPYESLAYDKRTHNLIGARRLPSPSVEFLDLEGRLKKRIRISSSSAVIRNMVITEADMLIMCDVDARKVLYVENTRENSHAKRFSGSVAQKIKDPQGSIALPGRNTILVFDGANGDVFATSLSLTVRRVHDFVIRKTVQGYPDVQFTLGCTLNENTLVVAFTDGIVSYYDIQSG